MKKSVKIGFPIVCVVIVGGTLIALGNLQNKVDEISASKKVNKVENSVNQIYENNNTVYNYEDDYNYIKNDKNSIGKNSIDNEAKSALDNFNKTMKNKTKNTIETNISKNKTNTNKAEEVKEEKTISDKDKAIAMVQDEWGVDSSVYFTNEGLSNGYYIIAVRDKSNTSVKMFYKVNLEENTVEMDR